MNNDRENHTRVNRFEKKRKNTKLVSVLSSLGGVVIIVLLGIFFFGGEESNEPQQQAAPDQTDQQETDKANDMEGREENQQENEQDVENSEEEQPAAEPEENEEENQESEEEESDSSGEQEENANPDRQQLDTSGDPNVKEAYTADWDPVGTSQQGPHRVVIDQGTQEWAEIMEAVSLATGLSEQDMIAWWVTMAGEQQVEATVSDSNETEVYRVHLQWVSNQGYRPERVEVLEENDQKHRS